MTADSGITGEGGGELVPGAQILREQPLLQTLERRGRELEVWTTKEGPQEDVGLLSRRS